MLFWILASALVALIGLLVVLALVRRHDAATPTAAYDVQVYRDQLSEVDKDQARGVISEEEAARTKLEISRRMLEADRKAQAPQGATEAPRGLSVAAAGIAVALLGGAFGLYQYLGAAGMPDAPLKVRFAEADAIYDARPTQDEAEKTALAARGKAPETDPKFTELMERLRATVAERPNDLRGLQLLATNEMNMGNFRAGWEAQRRLIALKGEAATAEDYAALGEFQTIAAGGLVTADAEAAFARALEIDHANPQALYYLGMMMGQNDRPDRAFKLWDTLLRVSKPDDPWVPVVMQNIEALAWLAGEENYTPPISGPMSGRGPSQADMAAAADMSPEDRAQMIRGMVEQLNARLASEGGTVEEWAKLISSLRMIGEEERANAVLAEARGKFADSPDDLAKIEAAAEAPLGAVSQGAPGGAPMASGMPGPTAQQMQDAQSMTPEERQSMIEGMVNGLVERLQAGGGSPAEWSRAVSSLATLGKADRAKEVLALAQTALAGDAAGLEAVMQAAQAAGVAP